MTLTAYSHRFAAELDVAQWLSRMGGIPIDSVDLRNIDDSFRRDAAGDLECPSCGARGAVLVSAGVGRRTGRSVRQATFRFNAPNGGDAHDPLCDFAGGIDSSTTPLGHVDYQSRDWLTSEIRRLVCAGIAAGVFTQGDMRAMRLWFLERRRTAQISVTLDERIPKIAVDIRRWYGIRSSIPFAPALGDVPGFDWKSAATSVVIAPFRPLEELFRSRRLWPGPNDLGPITTLVKRLQGTTTFDPTVLDKEFSAAESLVNFIFSNHSTFARRRDRCYHKQNMEPRAPLLAFASLLLFVSKWDLPTAARGFARVASATVESEVDGNLIGLNPFVELRSVALIKMLQEFAPQIDPAFVLSTAIDAQVEKMQREYEAWVLSGRPAN